MNKHGSPPYQVVLLHGGPAAPGEMQPVGEWLAEHGISALEPYQSKSSINDLVTELRGQITSDAEIPVTLIGWSWGAWLGVIFAAQHPELVHKLILIGSGPFDAQLASNIMDTRLSRMTESKRSHLDALRQQLASATETERNQLMLQIGMLFDNADSFAPLPHANDIQSFDYEQYTSIWTEASDLRQSGVLLDYVTYIKCPVVAIHGDYDPHPAAGVEPPLSRILTDFRFILLKQCGHHPWFEQHARQHFFQVLQSAIIPYATP